MKGSIDNVMAGMGKMYEPILEKINLIRENTKVLDGIIKEYKCKLVQNAIKELESELSKYEIKGEKK